MPNNELSATLVELLQAFQPPAGSDLVITEADLLVPLEVTSAVFDDELVFFASPPHSRWISGVLPTVHRARLLVELETPRERIARG